MISFFKAGNSILSDGQDCLWESQKIPLTNWFVDPEMDGDSSDTVLYNNDVQYRNACKSDTHTVWLSMTVE